MGARVAAHLLCGVPGDDGKPLPEVPAALKRCVKVCVCVDYPLLRVGSREPRVKPLLAMPGSGPTLLFVRGTSDKNMDSNKLPTKQIKPRAEVLVLDGRSTTPTRE